MKRTNLHHILKSGLASLLLLAGTPLLSSCSSDEMPDAPISEGQTVGFTIAVPRVNPYGTRAGNTWGDDYTPDDQGNEFENRINSLMPSLYLVEGSNITPAGTITVDNSKTTVTKVDNVSVYYYIEGKLHTNLSASQLNAGKFRLMVEANTENNHSWMPNRKYAMLGTQQELEQNDMAIPMWGVAEANFTGVGSTDENGNPTGLITIHPSENETDKTATVSLLRAAAKVTVKVDPSISDRNVILNSLTLNTAAEKGYIYPEAWNSVANTENLRFDATFNPFEELNNYQSEYVVPNPDEIPTEISFYLAETPNPGVVTSNHEPGASEDACTELKLEVNYSRDGLNEVADQKTGNLYFTDSSDATLSAHAHDGVNEENIVRNHIYEFTITGVADSFKPEVKLCVKKWAHEKVNVDL
ncbi:MAG: hypothetical protein K2M59_07160 [Muribaculaceae bacterium]|nr:hypothetical protein [Muribaculaceae bacterium]